MNEKHFKRQPLAVTVGIIAAAAPLVSVMLASELGMTRLEKEVMPLIDEAIEAARRGDTEGANRLAEKIDSLLKGAAPALMMIANHRDLMDLLEDSAKAALLGAEGERDDYIEELCAVRTTLRFILDNNDLTVGNIL